MREADTTGGRHIVSAAALVGHGASAGLAGLVRHAPTGPVQASDRCEAGAPGHCCRPASHPPRPLTLALAVLLFATGCAHHQLTRSTGHPVTSTPSVHGSSPGLGPEDSAQLAAVRFTTAMLARSFKDPTPTAYLDRAAPYMTVRLAVRLRQQAADTARAEWDTLRAAGAVRGVVIRHLAVHTPPPAPGAVAVTLVAHETTVALNGSIQITDEQVTLILHRLHGRWLVDYTSLDRW